jgi:threonine dehydratase
MRAEAVVEAAGRIRGLVRETPVERAEWGDCPPVYLKLEHLQVTGSFKFRGATNKIELLSADQAAAGVVAASNGNHGIGVAAAARRRGVAVEVYVSDQVSQGKLHRIEKYGARVVRAGREPLDAELAAREAAARAGKVFISPYNDVDVIAGQGTIGVELHRQVHNLDAVFVTAGGGGLIGGIGSYLKAVSPGSEIVGCWPENSPVLWECMRAGSVVEVPEQPTLSESTAGGLERGSVTLDLCRRVVDRAVMVSEAEILAAMRRVRDTEHWLIEGAAGVAVAAFVKDSAKYVGKTVAVVLCGRNLSGEALTQALT